MSVTGLRVVQARSDRPETAGGGVLSRTPTPELDSSHHAALVQCLFGVNIVTASHAGNLVSNKFRRPFCPLPVTTCDSFGGSAARGRPSAMLFAATRTYVAVGWSDPQKLTMSQPAA